MKPLFFLTILLLAGVLYVQWQVAPVPAPEIPTSAGGEDPVPPQMANLGAFSVSLDDISDYQIIVQKTLFSPDRQPPPEVEEVTEQAVDEKMFATLDFTAVIITPQGGSVALVRDIKSGEVMRLSAGQQLLGWTVKQVDAGSMSLESDGNEVKMALREYKAPEPEPAKALKPRVENLRRQLRKAAGRVKRD